MRTARYLAILSIEAVSVPLPPEIGRLAVVREKEEEGEPGNPTPLSLDDPDPSLPSLAGHCKRGEDVASDKEKNA
ncbi:hypothetical protein GW17_00043360, partial [Ensete ventricosum]